MADISNLESCASSTGATRILVMRFLRVPARGLCKGRSESLGRSLVACRPLPWAVGVAAASRWQRPPAGPALVEWLAVIGCFLQVVQVARRQGPAGSRFSGLGSRARYRARGLMGRVELVCLRRRDRRTGDPSTLV